MELNQSTNESKVGGNSPVYFWNIDDGRWQQFLSQWYNCRFRDEAGVEYKCTEMYMMYQKAMLFGDDKVAKKILGKLGLRPSTTGTTWGRGSTFGSAVAD